MILKFINLRGIYFKAIPEVGAGWFIFAIFVAFFIMVYLQWAVNRQTITGQTFPVWQVSIRLLIALPALKCYL